jgi:uncharacterized protein
VLRASGLCERRGIAALALMCVLLGGCTSVFLFPDRVHHFPDRSLGTPVRDAWIPAVDGGRLHALDLPGAGTPRAAVLFLHGNAENLSSHIHAINWLPARGYHVLALDYRGYGRSSGKAGIDAVHEDAQAALAWLAAREPGMPLIVYGQSLGGSIALRLVAQAPQRQRIVAVVAESAFASYRDIAREKLAQAWLTWPLQWPLSWLISDRHAAIEVVDRISPIPLLLIHGEQDRIVEVHHAQRLFEAAAEPKALWRIPEGRHIDALAREPLRLRLLEFLEAATAAAATRRDPAP